MFKDEAMDRLVRAERAIVDRGGMCIRNMRAFAAQGREHDRAVSSARSVIYHVAAVMLTDQRIAKIALREDSAECTDLLDSVIEHVRQGWSNAALHADAYAEAQSSKHMALDIIEHHLSRRMPVRVVLTDCRSGRATPYRASVHADMEVTMDTTVRAVIDRAREVLGYPIDGQLRGAAGPIEDWSQPMGRVGQPTVWGLYKENVDQGAQYGNILRLTAF